jgi:hypothetical protein
MPLVRSEAMDGWVTTWGCALQTPDGDDDPPLAGATLRQTIRVGLGGSVARLRLSNEYGRAPLRIAAAAVAAPVGGRAGADGIQLGTSTRLTVNDAAAFTVPPGQRVTTDDFTLPTPSRSNLTVTIRLDPAAPVNGITTHPGSRTTTYVSPACAKVDEPGSPTRHPWRTGISWPTGRCGRTGGQRQR